MIAGTIPPAISPFLRRTETEFFGSGSRLQKRCLNLPSNLTHPHGGPWRLLSLTRRSEAPKVVATLRVGMIAGTIPPTISPFLRCTETEFFRSGSRFQKRCLNLPSNLTHPHGGPWRLLSLTRRSEAPKVVATFPCGESGTAPSVRLALVENPSGLPTSSLCSLVSHRLEACATMLTASLPSGRSNCRPDHGGSRSRVRGRASSRRAAVGARSSRRARRGHRARFRYRLP